MSKEAAKLAELPMWHDPSTCLRRGFCPIMLRQGKITSSEMSHSIYYEHHGTESGEKVVFIMGVGESCNAWDNQLPYFVKKHSVLLFDNRGAGYSDDPKGPFTTSAMADDVVQLLDHVGWDQGREVHVIGSSLGGMIAQEVALMIPERILSLSLVTTKAGTAGFMAGLPKWRGLSGFVTLTMSKDDDVKQDALLSMIYPPAWLNARSKERPEKTNKQVAKEAMKERFAATRPQLPSGNSSQTSATFSHNVPPTKLNIIDETIPRTLILTGDLDDLIRPVNSEWMKKHMPRAEYVVLQGFGHGMLAQDPPKINAILEKIVREGKEIGSKAPWG